MTSMVDIEDLRVGMFVHLDLGWWAHPFALSSFMLTSPDQIATIRGLGLKQLRWSPDKSRLMDAPSSGLWMAPGEAAAEAVDGVVRPASANDDSAAPQDTTAQARERRRRALDAQRAAETLCQQQVGEARSAWTRASELVSSAPEHARGIAESLTGALLAKLMVDREMCVRVLSDAGADPVAGHALNVAVISLLMGRVFGFADGEMLDMGVGALLHDIGKLELPERVRQLDAGFGTADLAQYREHVALGMARGRQMGLSEGAMQVLGQHHEMADGSGFPQRLNLERMATAARIVALVNRYDNLCNPRQIAQALTPHEALSQIFAQSRSKFDVTMLNAFIRMMGVYPPGSVVQLTDDRYASVVSVNSSRPLKPRVLVCDFLVPADEALLLNLDQEADLGIRRSVKPAQLPAAVRDYLQPRQRMVYFFEPVAAPAQPEQEDIAA